MGNGLIGFSCGLGVGVFLGVAYAGHKIRRFLEHYDPRANGLPD